MSGNVWEWTRSLDGDYPYDSGDGREALGASGSRVVRGGSFYDIERYIRCAYRFRNNPDFGSSGFRVALVSPFFL
jgi:formylglycine-generating enzyme required for sulfatase activity